MRRNGRSAAENKREEKETTEASYEKQFLPVQFLLIVRFRRKGRWKKSCRRVFVKFNREGIFSLYTTRSTQKRIRGRNDYLKRKKDFVPFDEQRVANTSTRNKRRHTEEAIIGKIYGAVTTIDYIMIGFTTKLGERMPCSRSEIYSADRHFSSSPSQPSSPFLRLAAGFMSSS